MTLRGVPRVGEPADLGSDRLLEEVVSRFTNRSMTAHFDLSTISTDPHVKPIKKKSVRRSRRYTRTVIAGCSDGNPDILKSA